MADSKRRTATYKTIFDTGGVRYRFFCDVSGAAVCTTEQIFAGGEEALLTAWQTEGRPHFNRCEKCGRWCIDAMFNAEVHTCVECTPWESSAPAFCKSCGAPASPGKTVCQQCHKPLNY